MPPQLARVCGCIDNGLPSPEGLVLTSALSPHGVSTTAALHSQRSLCSFCMQADVSDIVLRQARVRQDGSDNRYRGRGRQGRFPFLPIVTACYNGMSSSDMMLVMGNGTERTCRKVVVTVGSKDTSGRLSMPDEIGIMTTRGRSACNKLECRGCQVQRPSRRRFFDFVPKLANVTSHKGEF
ncbi:hypothetical protein VTK26DRAFT_5037 [Humicola hyalothermophila]